MKKRFSKWLTQKISQPDIERLCREEETSPENRVLIVHSDDMGYVQYFPNHTKANTKELPDVSVIAEPYYVKIPVADGSYDTIVCTGLLEHVPDPKAVLDEFHRVLADGGKVVLSASYAFSMHNAPDNYFHFTVYGMRLLLEQSQFDIDRVEPSCKPFRTIAILLQRIGYQTEMLGVWKGLLFLVAKILPSFDVLIRKDFGGINRDVPVKSSLYSNVQAVAYKRQ